jgi:hypothetical protein
MTRVVITLYRDIGNLIPDLAKKVNGYGYDFHGPTVGFRFEDLPVIIERNQITLYAGDNEAQAHRLMSWLKEKLNKE